MSNCGCCNCGCGGAPGTHGTGGSSGGGPGKPGSGGSPPWTLPKQKVGTWLLIRYDSADQGARPIPAGDVFWESPDIWLTGGDGFDNPVGGQPAQVFARVWNLGMLVAAPVRVDFFYIAPSLGIQPSAPAPIGTAWTIVPPLSAVVVACPKPWIPPVTEFNLHSCLLATCSAPLTGDVPTVPANPVADRHTGQHNLTVIEAGGADPIPFTIHLGNLGPLPAKIELMAAASSRAHLKVAPHGFSAQPSLTAPIDAILHAAGTAQVQLWARRASLVLKRSGHAYHALPADEVLQALKVTGTRLGDIRKSPAVVAPANRFGSAGSSFTALGHAIELKAQQEAKASFSITPPRNAPHPWFVVHLAQAVNGLVVGGYTVIIRTRDK